MSINQYLYINKLLILPQIYTLNNIFKAVTCLIQRLCVFLHTVIMYYIYLFSVYYDVSTP